MPPMDVLNTKSVTIPSPSPSGAKRNAQIQHAVKCYTNGEEGYALLSGRIYFSFNLFPNIYKYNALVHSHTYM